MNISAWTSLWAILSRQIRHGTGQHYSGIYNRIHWELIRNVAATTVSHAWSGISSVPW
ncbi:hypothetical protein [Nonomuraea turkmeniaca]|uniref:hypothetical protein n=1 Tax=Nonomuraea turkmeniaca TaxID=103838 RepID=UPI0014774795|nr:hypothetical protein [Nonomuraea turkmeniaca]